ncbi:MAG: hypothetical protein Tsb009_32720 [Planctomycetaceae bacterium]
MSEFLEDYELCPMCGHEGFTQQGRCTNCGEVLVDPGEIEEAEDEPSKNPHWQIVFGVLLFLSFGIFALLMTIEAVTQYGRDRMESLLYAAALGCVALIGLNIIIRGAFRITR